MKKLFWVLFALGAVLLAPLSAAQADPGDGPMMNGEYYEQMEQYMDRMMEGNLNADQQREFSQMMSSRGWYGPGTMMGSGWGGHMWGMPMWGQSGGWFWPSALAGFLGWLMVLSLLALANVYLYKKVMSMKK